MPADQRRDQLLDAALEIIARDGYHAVSIEAIAREVDVTRPVVYNVFDGLDDLLYALLDRQERRALKQLAESVSLDVDLADLGGFIARTVDDLITMVVSDPSNWRLIFLAPTGTPAPVRSRIDRDRELVRRRVEGAVELAVTAGLLSSAVDPEVISHAFIALGEYFGRRLLEEPGSVDSSKLSATIAALLGTGSH